MSDYDDNEYIEPYQESLNESDYDDNCSLLLSKTIVYAVRENEIQKYILRKLILFYFYEKEIETLFNRSYNQVNCPYYNKYFIVTNNWMKHFLYYYNYIKVLPFIKKYKKKLNDEQFADLYIKLKLENINIIVTEIDNNKAEQIGTLLRSKKDFFPKKIKVEVGENKNKYKFYFYDQFIILNEKLYNEIKEDRGVTHNFQHDPKNVDKICLFQNIFIYRIGQDIFGIGKQLKSNSPISIYVFKILIIIITDNEFSSTPYEILKLKDLEFKLKNKNDYNIEVFKIEKQKHKKKDYILQKIDFSSKEVNINEEEIIKGEKTKKEKIESPKSNNINFKKITNIELINNNFYIEETKGDGNCLFNAFSQLIFDSDKYEDIIRKKINNYNKNNNGNNGFFTDKKEYIKNMGLDREYGGEIEILGFSELCEIRLTFFVRDITNENCIKSENDKITTYIYNENKEGNFAIILDNYIKRNRLNHYSSCKYKNGIGISNEKLHKIQEKLKKEDKNQDNNKDKKENEINKDKKNKIKENSTFINPKYSNIPNADYSSSNSEYNDFEYNLKINWESNDSILSIGKINSNNNNSSQKTNTNSSSKTNSEKKGNNNSNTEIKSKDEQKHNLFMTQPDKNVQNNNQNKNKDDDDKTNINKNYLYKKDEDNKYNDYFNEFKIRKNEEVNKKINIYAKRKEQEIKNKKRREELNKNEQFNKEKKLKDHEDYLNKRKEYEKELDIKYIQKRNEINKLN